MVVGGNDEAGGAAVVADAQQWRSPRVMPRRAGGVAHLLLAAALILSAMPISPWPSAVGVGVETVAAAQGRDDAVSSGDTGQAASSRRPRPAPAAWQRGTADAAVPASAERRTGGERAAAPDPGDGASEQGRPTDPARGRSRDRVAAAERNRGRAPEREDTARSSPSSSSVSRDAEPSGGRVWPMPSGDYEFSQSFGCVAQIGAWYGLAPGCPAAAPGFHTGIDLAAPEGRRFYSAASGWVIEAGLDRAVGIANSRIVVQHDGPNADYATEYLHWLVTYVQPGDYVRAGQPLGEVGSIGYSTGPHLHFGVVDLDSGEQIDPLGWLPPSGGNGSVYRGLAPGSRPLTIDGGNRNLPDYADPAPPPVPDRQPVPDRPAPAEERRPREGGDAVAAQSPQPPRSPESSESAESAEPRNAADRASLRQASAPDQTPTSAEEPPAEPAARDGGRPAGDDLAPVPEEDQGPVDGSAGRRAEREPAPPEGGEGGRRDEGGRQEAAPPPAEPVDVSPFVPDLDAIPAIAPAPEPPPAEEGGGGGDGGRNDRDRNRDRQERQPADG